MFCTMGFKWAIRAWNFFKNNFDYLQIGLILETMILQRHLKIDKPLYTKSIVLSKLAVANSNQT